ncbi:hypothetical protein [Chitinophaga sp.]|uniref:hypothetical protein n=1 Tax=Chitinophaga sp. TaxID=1869181 RepID=UPI0031DD9B18
MAYAIFVYMVAVVFFSVVYYPFVLLVIVRIWTPNTVKLVSKTGEVVKINFKKERDPEVIIKAAEILTGRR